MIIITVVRVVVINFIYRLFGLKNSYFKAVICSIFLNLIGLFI
ncbi:hypothetical protein ACWNX6_00835 [Candidatus Vidania fulgoroideorum]